MFSLQRYSLNTVQYLFRLSLALCLVDQKIELIFVLFKDEVQARTHCFAEFNASNQRV